MPKFRKMPVIVEAITFEELVAYGLAHGANVVNGMPWSFDYNGRPITHENDDCYLIPTLAGTMRFERGDMLITGIKGEIYPCKDDIFKATYEPVEGGEGMSDLKPGDHVKITGAATPQFGTFVKYETRVKANDTAIVSIEGFMAPVPVGAQYVEKSTPDAPAS